MEKTAATPSKQAQRSAATRGKVCAAAVRCLDELGYSETTLQRVQERAGVSRGALMYQFPSKEDLIVETLARILAPTRAGTAHLPAPMKTVARGISMREDLMHLWSQMVNSREARALVEVLVAARTDTALATKVEPLLQRYDNDINRIMVTLYESTSGNPDDVVQLWTICRVFMRALHIQQRFNATEEDTRAMVERFADLIAPHLKPLDKGAAP